MLLIPFIFQKKESQQKNNYFRLYLIFVSNSQRAKYLFFQYFLVMTDFILFIEQFIIIRLTQMPKNQASPSIHDIVLDQYKLNAKKDIKLIFQKVVYPNFPIHQFQLTGQLAKDHRYYTLVSELQSWNKNNNQPTNQNLRAQFTRNQFIYTSLKSILAHGSKGSQNYEINLQKLYIWYQNNCKQNHQFNFTSRKKKTIIEDDWKVRKTFKSNMPLEISTYERRMICMEPPIDEQAKQNEKQKLTIFQLEQFKIKQNRLRMERQKEEIKEICNRYTKNKRRSVQKLQKNYFIGKFNNTFKFFQKNEKNFHNLFQKKIDTLQFQGDLQGPPKFQKAEDIKNQIKRYRLNTTQCFRGKATQRRSYDPFARKKQKKNTTFSTMTQNSTFQQSLINNYDYPKQTYSRVEKAATFLSSIDGGSLIKNPFQKKKLKKIASKNR